MNTKKAIIILIILLFIIIIVSGIILYLLNDNNGIKKRIASPATEDIVEIEETLKEVTIRNNFYIVKNCIMKFYTYYSDIYNNEKTTFIMDEEAKASIEIEKKRNIEAIYSILDENYKSYKNITVDNVTSKLPSIETNTIDIAKMYVAQKNENISTYLVYGYLIDTSTSKTSKFTMMVNVDMLNRTYTVFLGDYVKEKYDNIEIGSKIEGEDIQQIKNNTYNTFKYQTIEDDTYIYDMFKKIRENMIYNSSQVYKNLEETYKQKRFPTIEDFEEYINNQMKEISIMQLSKYRKIKFDEYTQYICLTNNDKYFIINENSPMNYTVILDTYTIDLPEFIEQYEKASDEKKTGLNMNKIIEAIKESDYKYIYNKLDQTFKNNKFSTEESFKKYFDENFANNEFEQTKIEENGQLYLCEIANKEKTIKKTFVMKLLEGTGFVCSFNVE